MEYQSVTSDFPTDFEDIFDDSPPTNENAAPAGTGSGVEVEVGLTLQSDVYSEKPSESILDRRIALTRFPTMGAGRKHDLQLSLRELAAELPRQSAPAKDGLPWYKFATFGDLRTEKGSLRNNDNVLSVTGIEADYDLGEMSLAEAERRLRAADVAALLYTTAKHTDEAPRWRAFCPFDAAHLPDERTRYMERLNGILDGELDGASFTLSQSYYAGNIEGLPPIAVRLIDGRAIDLADELDATALPKGKRRENGATCDHADKSGSGALYALACQLKASGCTIEEFRDALALEAHATAAEHVTKENKAGKGRGERAIKRAWERAPDIGDDFDDLPDLDSPVPAAVLRFLSPGDCADAPSRGYILKGLLAPGDVGCIYGAPGAGKSLISPHLGYAVAQGRAAFGMRTKPGRVWYVAAEDPHGMRGRVSALKRRHGDADDFKLVEGVSDLLSPDSADRVALLAAVAETKPALIFIDTLAMAFPGLEENSAEQMGLVVAMARKLAAHGAAVVLIHHDTKAGTPTPRGHSLLNGALDVALQLFARDDQGIVRGKLSKNRNGACDRDVAFRIATETLGHDEDGDPITVALVNELDAAEAKPTVKLKPTERAALDVLDQLERVGNDRGQVDEALWRSTCIDGRAVSASDDRDNRKRSFNKALQSLILKGIVDAKDGFVRRTEPQYPDFDGDPFDMGDLS